MIASCSFADDIIPHLFESGDVISADVLNEALGMIGNSIKLLTMDDLVGTWQCSKFTHRGVPNSTAGYQYYDPDEIWAYVIFTLTINDDGDSTFTWNTSGKHPWMNTTTDDIPITASIPDITAFDSSGSIAMAANRIIARGNVTIDGQVGNDSWYYSVEKMSNSLFRLVADASHPILLLEKQNIPPASPTQLSAVVDGLTVTLTWLDNSNEETGFKILRKDSTKGVFNSITTTGADTITYEDSVSNIGRYWYRVIATNANGDSIGTKVVKVIVIGE